MINTGVKIRDLTAGLARPPFRFIEHDLASGAASPVLRHLEDHRTFVVIGGRVRLESAAPGSIPREYGYLQGWHALQDAAYRFVNSGAAPAVVVEAGSITGPTLEEADFTGSPASGVCIPVDSYRVDKPWGHEVWYTHNVPGLPYALKQIHMTAGHQSSLQSHEYKIETNFVVDGEATVLNGTLAPANRNSVIDIGTLPRAVYTRRSGWSSERNVLHRVIAHNTYTSVEVSTAELDDVIRWADDSNRGNGRIAAEHEGASR